MRIFTTGMSCLFTKILFCSQYIMLVSLITLKNFYRLKYQWAKFSNSLNTQDEDMMKTHQA